MPMHDDDDQFEIYLRQFRPREPEPLPLVMRARHVRRALALGAWAAAIVLTAALLATKTRWTAGLSHYSANTAPQTRDFHPLTIRAADQLLAHAPSFKAAMDELALDSEQKALPKSQSAFSLLNKEDVNP